MCTLHMDICFTRTLVFQIDSKRKSLFFIGPSAEVRKITLFIKIATSAVNLAGILLPKMVRSISFWEQCSRAPPFFAPLNICAQAS